MIIQSDCLEWMHTQPDNSVDTIIFSPPYNKKGLRNGTRTSTELWKKANIDYGIYEDCMEESVYQEWQIQVVNECVRLLKPTGSIFYQHKIRNWGRKGSHPMEWLSHTNAQFYQEIIWNRSSTTAIDANYLFTKTERVYWLTKHTPKVNKGQVDPNFRGDIWNIAPQKNQKHPAPFPPKLVENCVLLTTQQDDLVYDPFAGSGTTNKVCERLRRNHIGTEIDPEYIKLYNTTNQYNELFEWGD